MGESVVDQAQAQAQAQENRRRCKRQDVAIPSRLRYGAWETCEIEIENISFSGFRAICEQQLEAGSVVSVDLPNVGRVRAQIAWCANGRIGAAFNKVVDVRRCVLGEMLPGSVPSEQSGYIRLASA